MAAITISISVITLAIYATIIILYLLDKMLNLKFIVVTDDWWPQCSYVTITVWNTVLEQTVFHLSFLYTSPAKLSKLIPYSYKHNVFWWHINKTSIDAVNLTFQVYHDQVTPSQDRLVIQFTVNHTLAVDNDILNNQHAWYIIELIGCSTTWLKYWIVASHMLGA